MTSQRGYALFTVTMLVALVSVVGMSVLDIVDVELILSRYEARHASAREVAEGALLEVINDDTTSDLLPMLDSPTLSAAYAPPPNSPFNEGRRTYTANAVLLRVSPLAESSHSFSRVVVHELVAESDVSDGEATFESAVQIFRTATFRPGLVLPRRHAR